jgi:riboflavin kinase/FMN adenylyltransferase
LGRADKLIYTFSERVALLSDAGADAVLAATFSEDFMRLPAGEFLNALTDSGEIAALTCGPDYAYGFGGTGNADGLAAYCAARGILFRVVPFVTENGVKISSTAVRDRLKCGDITTANRFLGAPYSVRGRVERGRSVGRLLSYPTVNLSCPDERLRIKDGVYATRTVINGAEYASVTNVGPKPTFGVSAGGIETFIIDYNKDIYGEEVKVEFLRYMRPVRTFGGADALREQLGRDVRNRLNN